MSTRVFFATLFFAISNAAMAAGSNSDTEEVTVIGVTPVSGSGLPEEQIPYPITTIGSEDLQNAQSIDFIDFAQRRISGIITNDAQNNRRQADIIYHGYTASPLIGLPQGMSVYLNGVRMNEPFGDTVNWDLISGISVRDISLAGGANPVYGLNTLGGAIVVNTHTGFSTPGTRLSVEGGSFSTQEVQVSTGGNNGNIGYFIGTEYFGENGWRDASGSDVRNIFANIGHESADTTLNLNLNLSDNELIGNGSVPEDVISLYGRERIFTSPDITNNDLRMVDLQFSHALDDSIQFAGSLFFRRNDASSFNGDGSEFESCGEFASEQLEDGLTVAGVTADNVAAMLDNSAADSSEQLCETEGFDDDTTGYDEDANSFDTAANFLAAVTGERIEDQNGNFIAEEDDNDVERNAINNTSVRRQDSYGGTLQAIFSNDLLNLQNQLITGVDYYYGDVTFSSEVEIASLNADRSTAATGLYVPEEGVALDVKTRTYSGYFTDTMSLTDSLFFTLSGRYNHTRIKLEDQGGVRGRTNAQPELNGSHTFTRFNPAAGVSFVTANGIKLFTNYSESSRAPSPVELACAREEAPCSLPNAFLADPPLEQVITRSVDIGGAGNALNVDWQLDLYWAQNEDDIIFQTTAGVTSNEGFFRNVGNTRRMGLDLALGGNVNEYLSWNLGYSYIRATYEDDFSISSPNHVAANSSNNGRFLVEKGDRIPGIPEHSIKSQLTMLPTVRDSVTLEAIFSGSRHYRGDEANLDNEIGSYVVFNLLGRHKLNDNISLTARVENLFDREYNTFGLYGEPDEVGIAGIGENSSRRFVAPGMPRAYYVGLNVSFQ